VVLEVHSSLRGCSQQCRAEGTKALNSIHPTSAKHFLFEKDCKVFQFIFNPAIVLAELKIFAKIKSYLLFSEFNKI